MPEDLKLHITGLPVQQRNQVWIHCHGEHPLDKENIGPINYVSKRGFPAYFFPYTNVPDYLSPLVAVRLERPKRKFTFYFAAIEKYLKWNSHLFYYSKRGDQYWVPRLGQKYQISWRSWKARIRPFWGYDRLNQLTTHLLQSQFVISVKLAYFFLLGIPTQNHVNIYYFKLDRFQILIKTTKGLIVKCYSKFFFVLTLTQAPNPLDKINQFLCASLHQDQSVSQPVVGCS